MIDRFELLFRGCPVVADRGYLGWTTVAWFQAGGKQILFDTGWFGDWPPLEQRLAAVGSDPAAIDIVVLSHLHFDHMGNGERFPRAEIRVSSAEWEYATEHAGRDPAIPAWSLQGLENSGRLRLVDPGSPIVPGLALLPTPGHTAGHMSVTFAWNDVRYVIAGDAVKSRAHLSGAVPLGGFNEDMAWESLKGVMASADIVVPGHDVPLQVMGATSRPLERAGDCIRAFPGITGSATSWEVEIQP